MTITASSLAKLQVWGQVCLQQARLGLVRLYTIHSFMVWRESEYSISSHFRRPGSTEPLARLVLRNDEGQSSSQTHCPALDTMYTFAVDSGRVTVADVFTANFLAVIREESVVVPYASLMPRTGEISLTQC